jgi:hypothetical protein
MLKLFRSVHLVFDHSSFLVPSKENDIKDRLGRRGRHQFAMEGEIVSISFIPVHDTSTVYRFIETLTA